MISTNQLWWGHQIPFWYPGDETYVVDAERAKLARLREELEAL